MCRITIGCANGFSAPYLLEGLIDIAWDMSVKANRDGFGVYISNVGSDQPSAMYKKAKPCGDVVLTQDYWKWQNANNTGFGPYITHVRQATTGKSNLLNDAYAHPYILDNMTLVHNGHLINADEVRKNLGIDEKIVIDSEIFLHALHQVADGKPLDLEAIQKTVNMFYGPFVFVVHEQNSPDVWLIVGKSRTLHHYAHPDYTVVITETGYANALTRAIYRNSFAYDMEYHPFDYGRKLNQDTVFKLNEDGLQKVGEIKSEEDLPKLVQVVKQEQSALPEPKSTGTNTIEIDEVMANIEKRRRICKSYGITEVELGEVCAELYPLVTMNIYALTDEYLDLLDGFFRSLKMSEDDTSKRFFIWRRIQEKLPEDIDPYIYIRTHHNPDFIIPFFMNNCVELSSILEEELKINAVPVGEQ
jgi:predicted glutamine amidotransferase